MEPNETYSKDFRGHLSTVDAAGKRIWIYPKLIKGKLYKYRTILSYVLLAILFGLPHIYAHGEPFVLFNIIERKFIIFGQIFWPQDFHLFVFGMLGFVLFVIVFTVIFGRFFCGWICPQTIFLEMVFRKIERFIEGDHNAQKKLNQGKWSENNKALKKTAKHIVFFGISYLVANTFLAYIIGSEELFRIQTDNPANHLGGLAAITIFSFAFYGVFAFFREQVCTNVCPYGRLQGVLLDRNSILVAYDYVRGEPRGKLSDKTNDKGDCVNCHACVRVCPTGIDIRNGTQLECVNCTACIDACDEIMDHVNKPKGLIRYASENGIALKEQMTYTWRLKLYTLVLSLLLIFLGVLLVTRADVAARMMRTPGQTYQLLAHDRISNLYNIKLVNKTRKNIHLDLKLENMKGEIKQVGVVDVPKESYFQTSFFITLKNEQLKSRKTKVKIGIYENGKRVDVLSAIFLGPSI